MNMHLRYAMVYGMCIGLLLFNMPVAAASVSLQLAKIIYADQLKCFTTFYVLLFIHYLAG